MKNILVGFDGFDRGEGVPAIASALADEYGAQLHLVNVAPPVPKRFWSRDQALHDELVAALIKTRADELDKLLASAKKRGIKTRAVVRLGDPHVELIREAAEVSADLVIVTDRPSTEDGRGFTTVTQQLFRECPFPVLAKRDHRRYRHRQILAAVDLEAGDDEETALNKRVLETAVALGRRSSAQVIVLHAWQLWGETLLRSRSLSDESEVRQVLDETHADRTRRLDELIASVSCDGVEVEAALVKDQPKPALLRVAEKKQVDLVVLGTICRTGLAGKLIGNTAERLLNTIQSSVVAVKPPGFVSPVLADD